MIKSRRMRWAGHAARWGEMWGAYRIWLESLKGGDCCKDWGVDGRIILKLMLGKWVGGCGLELLGSGWVQWKTLEATVMNFWGFFERGTFLHKLSDYQLLKDSSPRVT
jgi:hypothetical protein